MQPSKAGPNWHHGRAGAPKGTKEWADNLRLSLLNQCDHLGEGESDFLLYVDTLKREEGWKLLTKPDGSTFASFDEFCAFKKPYGLGTTWDKLRPFVDAGLAKQGKLSTSPNTIPLASIRLDGGTQSRAGIDDAVVSEYADHVDALPPVVVFYDGTTYWLADGFHRVSAHQRAGRDAIAADVRQGSCRDAVLFSVGANAAHGLRRTTADKQRAVELLLRDEEWGIRSNEWISERCYVDPKTVSARRKALVATREIPELKEREGKDGKTRKLPTKPPNPPVIPDSSSPSTPDRETAPKSTLREQSQALEAIANEGEKNEKKFSPVESGPWADTTDAQLLDQLAGVEPTADTPPACPPSVDPRQVDMFADTVPPRPVRMYSLAVDHAVAAVERMSEPDRVRFFERVEHMRISAKAYQLTRMP